MKTMRLTAIVALVLGIFTAAQAATPVEVHDAWIREAPPGMAMMAGYMVIENKGNTPLALTGAEGEAFGEVMLHRTVVVDGMARMEHQPLVEVPAGGSVSFEPGGLHLMLMDPKRPLRAGDHVDLHLNFADGMALHVDFEVRRPGEGMGESMPHHHEHMQ